MGDTGPLTERADTRRGYGPQRPTSTTTYSRSMVTGNVSATYGPFSRPSIPGSVSPTAPDWVVAAAISAGVVPGFGGGALSASTDASSASSATISAPGVTVTS